MISAVTFFVGFIAGPLVFWIVAKQRPTRPYMVTLWAISVVLVVGAVATRQFFSVGPYTGLTIILAFWLAWILVLALLILAVRRRTSMPMRTKQIAFGVAAAATTIPWFGLYIAQMVSN